MRFIALAVCTAIVAPATSAMAQQPAEPGARAAKLQEADKDKDGAISKAEWTAAGRPDRAFAIFDADGDGKITQAELVSGRQKMQERRAGRQ